MVVVDDHDVQGNVLHGLQYRTARFLYFTVTDADDARRWLQRHVVDRDWPTAGTWTPTRPATAVNVALTHPGLAALGLPPAALRSFPDDFREGMYRRLATHLREQQPGDWRQEWYRDEPGPRLADDGDANPNIEVHLLVVVHAGTAPGDLGGVAGADVADELTAAAGSSVVHLGTTLTQIHGELTERKREHFGFTDGISQPYFEGVTYRPTRSSGARVPYGSGAMVRRRYGRAPGWRGLKPGELVLGYPDEDLESPPLPEPVELVRNGSYLVVRRIRQHVTAFYELEQAHLWFDGDGREAFAAKLVGRYRSGEPLLSAGADPDLNQFTYRGDEDGYRCPLGSHIRRSNPRDSLPLDPSIVNRHRMVRRGMPYGPAYDPAAPDHRARGLLFLAYCADIRRQFEFVQREWLGDGNVFGQGHTRDIFAGEAASFVIQHPTDPAFIRPARVIEAEGGEYFFQPGRRAFADLVAGRFSTATASRSGGPPPARPGGTGDR
jgi:Dyp-type peroxidase family